MRDELVERMARAIYEHRNGYGCTPWNIRSRSHRDPYLADATAALRAIEEAEAVVVPKVIDDETADHLWRVGYDEWAEFGSLDQDAGQAIYRAMVAASPYTEKNDDTR